MALLWHLACCPLAILVLNGFMTLILGHAFGIIWRDLANRSCAGCRFIWCLFEQMIGKIIRVAVGAAARACG